MFVLPLEGTHYKECKTKKENSSIHGKANLIQEAESDEDEAFNVYHQRVFGRKTATYVAKVKTENENVALEIDNGASVNILNKKTCDLMS